jgi:hypothetical protein
MTTNYSLSICCLYATICCNWPKMYLLFGLYFGRLANAKLVHSLYQLIACIPASS